jgi:hypothetical protein
MEKVDSQVYIYIDLYKRGKLGTPENPNRGSSSKYVFWDCYFGHRKPSEYRNTLHYPAALAGLRISKGN